jgi:hypothetical protein
VAGRGRVRGGAGGGEDVQALRPNRARVATALGALAAAAGLAAYAGAHAGRYEWAPLVAGLAALALLLPALALDLGGAIPPALTLLAGAYAGSLLLRGDRLDPYAPLVGAGLLLCGELAYLSLELRPRAEAEQWFRLRRLAALAAVVAGGAVAGALVLLGAAPPAGGGAGWEAVGAAATVAALGVVALLARQA